MDTPCSPVEDGGAKKEEDGGAAEEETAAPLPPEDVVYALVCNMCRGNKFVLCVAEDLMQDDVNSSPGMPRLAGCAWNSRCVHAHCLVMLIQPWLHRRTDCGSYFLENVKDWMEECAASIEGKLNCPACRSARAIACPTERFSFKRVMACSTASLLSPVPD